MGTDGPSIDAGLLGGEEESTGEGGRKERGTVYRIARGRGGRGGGGLSKRKKKSRRKKEKRTERKGEGW